MIQRQPHRTVITTPKGKVHVERPLYERLEASLQPDDLGSLRSYDWWVQLSELITGIQIDSSVQESQTTP